MSEEILRFVDTIHRDRQVDKEVIFTGIEMALVSAAQKRFDQEEGIEVIIDRESGAIRAHKDGVDFDPREALGRIAAGTGKQVLFQKIREAEREVIYREYIDVVGEIFNGTVASRAFAIATICATLSALASRTSLPLSSPTAPACSRVRGG